MNKQYQYINDRIREYGAQILVSAPFARAMAQQHHYGTSVGRHSLMVAEASLAFCQYFETHGKAIDTRTVVVAALCHDLGMVGRYEKYKSNFQCCRRHPGDSVKLAKTIIPDLDEKTCKIIKRHMWPLCLHPPTSREELAVVLADKYVSIQEVISKNYRNNK